MDSTDPGLVDEWLLRRNLARTVPVGPEADLCVTPLRYAVYARFLSDLRFNDCLEPPGRLREGENAVGMWPIYVDKFLRWADHYAEAGHRYRLPRAEELDRYFDTVPAEAVPHPLWVEAAPSFPRLYCPPGVAHTCAVERAAVAAALETDLDRTRGHRMLAMAIQIAMQRKNAGVENPMLFRHSFELARAADTDQPSNEIFEAALKHLLARIRTVSGFRGWRPAFGWEGHLARLDGNAFLRSLVDKGFFPARPGADDLLAVRAHLVLISLWTRDAVERPGPAPDAAAQERLLRSAGTIEEEVPVFPDEVVPAIRAAKDSLAARDTSDSIFAPLGDKAIGLLRDCERLIAPMLERQARFDAGQVASARVALVAAAAVAHGFFGDAAAVEHLRRAIGALAVVSFRAGGGPVRGGELLMLVRERLEPVAEDRPVRPRRTVGRGRLAAAFERVGAWWRRLSGDRSELSGRSR